MAICKLPITEEQKTRKKKLVGHQDSEHPRNGNCQKAPDQTLASHPHSKPSDSAPKLTEEKFPASDCTSG